MLEDFRMDLHVHTCLSPCGGLTMLPTTIIDQAKSEGLDGIGICDHNSAENVPAVKKAGQKEGITVVGGMEITSREEVHILALFENDAFLWKMQGVIYENLSGINDKDRFGHQLIVDENDKIVDRTDRLLIGATALSVDEIVTIIHNFGGVAIASHVDRESFSIIGQLGFIPPQLSLDALELSPNYESSNLAKFRSYGYPLVTFSDAHYLPDIGKAFTTFSLWSPTSKEVIETFHNYKGNKVRI